MRAALCSRNVALTAVGTNRTLLVRLNVPVEHGNDFSVVHQANVIATLAELGYGIRCRAGILVRSSRATARRGLGGYRRALLQVQWRLMFASKVRHHTVLFAISLPATPHPRAPNLISCRSSSPEERCAHVAKPCATLALRLPYAYTLDWAVDG